MPQESIGKKGTCGMCKYNRPNHRYQKNGGRWVVHDFGECQLHGKEVMYSEKCKDYQTVVNNILFIGYGILGDFIVCLKSIELLRRVYPDACITYVGNKTFAQLGLNDYHIDEVLDRTDELNQYYQKRKYQSDYWDAVFKNSSLIINHLMDPENIFVSNMQNLGFNHKTLPIDSFFFSINNKTLLHGEVQDREANAYAQVGELLLNIGITTYDWSPNLLIPDSIKRKVPQELKQWSLGLDNKIWGFHPGASSSLKLLSLWKWKQIIHQVILPEDKIIVFSGPSEEKLLPEVKEILSEHQTIYLHNLPLQQAAAFLSHCNYFLGHDTGFAHIAGALKIPSFLIFGPHSSAKVWKPPFRGSKAYVTNDLTTLNADEVTIEVKVWLDRLIHEK